MLKDRKAMLVFGLLAVGLLGAAQSGAFDQKELQSHRVAQGQITPLATTPAQGTSATPVAAAMGNAVAKAGVGAVMGLVAVGPMGSTTGALAAGLGSLAQDLINIPATRQPQYIAQALLGTAQGVARFPVRYAEPGMAP